MPVCLKASYLTKKFPGVVALEKVCVSVAHDEFVAVIGENGAGKSTLMKILAGIETPDEGTIEFEGRTVVMRDVTVAQSMGIALIHQELNLADNLDVAGNVYLGREPRRGMFLQHQVMRERTQQILHRLGATFAPDTLVSELSLGQRQMVEIAKALSLDAKLLIMDEPTSSLSARETDALFEVIAGLRADGISILYISHRLSEVKQLADRVVALRDGKNAGELCKAEITHDAMISLMVGRDMSHAFDHVSQSPGEVMLDVQGLKTIANPMHAITFQLRKGEIVGMAGLVGSGRTEILRALFGVEPSVRGEVSIDGQAINASHPEQAVAAGLALVPEDRKALGVFLPESVQWNVTLPSLRRDANAGVFLNKEAATTMSVAMKDLLHIKTASLETKVGTLSGGNQQKVALGKWLVMNPKVLLLDEPTRGIDVGAKREIYQLMEKLASEGMAILFVSSEMEEVIALSDRVLVMHEGRMAGELTAAEINEETIMRLATGRAA
ncbi:sugar ABC transporter ATP-binding protein [soil metagenome]